MYPEINQVAIFFRASFIYDFVVIFKRYGMSYVRTSVTFALLIKYSMKDKYRWYQAKYKLFIRKFSRLFYEYVSHIPIHVVESISTFKIIWSFFVIECDYRR